MCNVFYDVFTLQHYPENKQSVTDAIIKTITESCDCQYLSNFITNQSLQCHGSENNEQLLYQAHVYGTHEIQAHLIVEYIQDWVNSIRPTVTFKISNHLNAELPIDERCQVAFSSVDDLNCYSSSLKGIKSSLPAYTTSDHTSLPVYTTSDHTSLPKQTLTLSDSSLSSSMPTSQSNASSIIYSVSALICLCFLIFISCACILVLIVKKRKAPNNEHQTM